MTPTQRQAREAVAKLPTKPPGELQALIDGIGYITASEHPTASFATVGGLMQVMILELARDRLREIAEEAQRQGEQRA